VNGKMVPLRYKLKNGDIVEILTSPGHKPSRTGWAFTVTNKAKAKVRHYLNTTEKQQALEIGRSTSSASCGGTTSPEEGRVRAVAPRIARPGARGGLTPRRPLRRPRLRQDSRPADPLPASVAPGEAGTGRPGESPGRSWKRSAPLRRPRGAHKVQGHRRLSSTGPSAATPSWASPSSATSPGARASPCTRSTART